MNFLLQNVLSTKYNFIAVDDVFQGVHQLKKRQEIELVLIDVDSHTQECWDFIQHIKTSRFYQDKQIVILVSKDNKRINEIKTLGDCSFFYKPFSPLDMIKTVDELMFAEESKIN